MNDRISTEVAIVGSGPGGSVTAAMLAEAGYDVVLIEEGRNWRPDAVEQFSRAELELLYRNGGVSATLGTPSVVFAEGRCVGGGSEVNSGIYHRTPPETLERWGREYGVLHVSADEMEPHFEAVEAAVGIELSAVPVAPASQRLHDGAAKLGWSAVEAPRFMTYERGSEGELTPRRQTMSRTLIPRARAAGCRLMADTRVERLRRVGSRWELHAIRSTGGRTAPVTIDARIAFVCAGATQTPALLQRSGFRANVGTQLQVHPTVKIAGVFHDEINHHGMGVGVHQVKEFAPRLSIGCSISSRPYLAMALAEYPDDLARLDETWTRSVVYYVASMEGRGRVWTVPGLDDPLVAYRIGQRGFRDLLDGFLVLGRCMFAAGATALFPSVSGRNRAVHTMGELEALTERLDPRDLLAMTIHLFSSVPLGEDMDAFPLDSYGAVRGTEGLFVNDASMLCTSSSVNPQGSIMAFAHRNVRHLLEREGAA